MHKEKTECDTITAVVIPITCYRNTEEHAGVFRLGLGLGLGLGLELGLGLGLGLGLELGYGTIINNTCLQEE